MRAAVAGIRKKKKIKADDSITFALLSAGADKPVYYRFNRRIFWFTVVLFSVLSFAALSSIVYSIVRGHSQQEALSEGSTWKKRIFLLDQKKDQIYDALNILEKEGFTLEKRLWGTESGEKKRKRSGSLSRDFFYKTQSLHEAISLLQNREEAFQAMPVGMPLRNAFITSLYGKRISPFGFEINFHTGVDFANSIGTPVIATAPGTAIHSGPGGGYGNHVILLHDHGFETLYAHMTHTNVELGSYVKRGDVVGFLGMTGSATGPHVHYEVRLSDANPFDYLKYTLNPWPFVKETL